MAARAASLDWKRRKGTSGLERLAVRKLEQRQVMVDSNTGRGQIDSLLQLITLYCLWNATNLAFGLPVQASYLLVIILLLRARFHSFCKAPVFSGVTSVGVAVCTC